MQCVADRLDKLEAFLAECDGDETRHPTYGDPSLYKPKRVSKPKGATQDERWTWIDQARPDLCAFSCSGRGREC